MARQYLDHLRTILTDERSGYKPNRTGIDSISLFGYQNEYDLSEEGFPLLTTKRMHTKAITHELLWFLRGDTNIKYLVDNGVRIWDGNAFQHHLKKGGLERKLPMYSPEWNKAKEEFIQRIREDPEFASTEGNLGDVYGAQWRHWKYVDEAGEAKEVDQLADVVHQLKNKPDSRRIILTAWNPPQIPNMALPPCHMLAQFNVLGGNLDCQLYQRSCDMFLGVPFNIASYAMLTHILAQEADLSPGRFIHTFGDSHIYCGADERGKFYGDNLSELKITMRTNNQERIQALLQRAPAENPGKEGQDHVPMVIEQLTRTPGQLPQIQIAQKPFDQLTIDDIAFSGYKPQPAIKAAMAV